MNKAVFIDKDGTLIKDVPYNVNTNLIQFEEYAIEALQLLQAHGYQLIIVSNQPGIAFSYFTEEDVQLVFQFVEKKLLENGVQLNGYYYCPHHIQGNRAPYAKACYCRKPMPGMLLQAAMERDINLEESWMIGDILNDIEAGNRAGCTSILLNNGNETEWVPGEGRSAAFVCDNWAAAAAIIIEYVKATTRVEPV